MNRTARDQAGEGVAVPFAIRRVEEWTGWGVTGQAGT
ncbi:hypothetical protein SAMN05216276_1001178 [Streptosporangium subroseum]|uniref:Uncharacterized protein n=1 Tax=Streptosporangium subroseum TaxID=106412 RepID=A0A239A757_9ACTN|nr:hypothetical protein SAMN05216276_1001178 [Streptosporangium subroseum]